MFCWLFDVTGKRTFCLGGRGSSTRTGRRWTLFYLRPQTARSIYCFAEPGGLWLFVCLRRCGAVKYGQSDLY